MISELWWLHQYLYRFCLRYVPSEKIIYIYYRWPLQETWFHLPPVYFGHKKNQYFGRSATKIFARKGYDLSYLFNEMISHINIRSWWFGRVCLLENINGQGTHLLTRNDLIPAWKSNHIRYKVWNEDTFPFPKRAQFGNGYIISPTLFWGN